MVSKLYFVTLLHALLSLLSRGEAVDVLEECYNTVETIGKTQMGNLVPCIRELGLNTPKDRAQNYNCIMKCVLVKAGTLADDGRISIIKGLSFILYSFPNILVEKALKEILKCQEHATIVVDDPNDKFCTNLKPIVNCGIDFIFSICKK